jgi:hypothetical protein
MDKSLSTIAIAQCGNFGNPKQGNYAHSSSNCFRGYVGMTATPCTTPRVAHMPTPLKPISFFETFISTENVDNPVERFLEYIFFASALVYF